MQISIARAVGAAQILTVLALITALPTTAHAADYKFDVIADNIQNNFTLNNFVCASINNDGEIAFKANRLSADGVTTFDVISRGNVDGTLTTIALASPDNPSPFSSFADFTSINDSGEVAFGARLPSPTQFPNNAILVGDGGAILTIAQSGNVFNNPFFEFSINDSGEVAFNGQLAPSGVSASPIGLFSGAGGAVTTHYLNSADILVGDLTGRFSGSFGFPSINTTGDIAFAEIFTPGSPLSPIPGIFVGQNGSFKTISSSMPSNGFFNFGDPSLNDSGTAAFTVSFFDSNGQFVTAIVKGDGGPLTTVADTSNGVYTLPGSPSLNNNGDVVFSAFINDKKNPDPISGIFTGPDPKTDKVIAAGDKVHGKTVRDLGPLLCEHAINDSGQVAFIANLDDPHTPFGQGRTVVVRATPKH